MLLCVDVIMVIQTDCISHSSAFHTMLPVYSQASGLEYAAVDNAHRKFEVKQQPLLLREYR